MVTVKMIKHQIRSILSQFGEVKYVGKCLKFKKGIYTTIFIKDITIDEYGLVTMNAKIKRLDESTNIEYNDFEEFENVSKVIGMISSNRYFSDAGLLEFCVGIIKREWK